VSALIVSSAGTTFFGAGQPLSERQRAPCATPFSSHSMRLRTSLIVRNQW
jgi:hypothetical protein